MPGTTMLHVRVDEDVKEKASEALGLMGLDCVGGRSRVPQARGGGAGDPL